MLKTVQSFQEEKGSQFNTLSACFMIIITIKRWPQMHLVCQLRDMFFSNETIGNMESPKYNEMVVVITKKDLKVTTKTKYKQLLYHLNSNHYTNQ